MLLFVPFCVSSIKALNTHSGEDWLRPCVVSLPRATITSTSPDFVHSKGVVEPRWVSSRMMRGSGRRKSIILQSRVLSSLASSNAKPSDTETQGLRLHSPIKTKVRLRVGTSSNNSTMALPGEFGVSEASWNLKVSGRPHWRPAFS